MSIFCGQSLKNYFSQINESICRKIYSYDYRQIKDFTNEEMEELINYYMIDRIVIDYSYENAIKSSPCKTVGEIDNQEYLFFHRGNPTVRVKGIQIKIEISINEGVLTKYSPVSDSIIYMMPPADDNYKHINLSDNNDKLLYFFIFIPNNRISDSSSSNDLANIVKKEFNSYLLGTKTMVERMNNMIDGFNNSLRSFIGKTIKEKISEDSKLALLSDAIGIEVTPKNDKQEKGKKIEIFPKKLDLMLPERKKYDGFYIDKENYSAIISTIRNHLVATENNPLAIRKLNDEELIRDTILWSLNSNYFIASGETFRQNGKTDILINFKDKSAFIAECKIWRGEKYVNEAIDQLLSYTTWRDSKACIIIFNLENKDYSAVCKKVLEIAKRHSSFKKISSECKEWEFECVYNDLNNSESSITITFLCANYVSR